MSDKKMITKKSVNPKFDKKAFLKSAEKVAKILEKEKAQQQNA
jgi:hypothetical protein